MQLHGVVARATGITIQARPSGEGPFPSVVARRCRWSRWHTHNRLLANHTAALANVLNGLKHIAL